MVGNSVGTTVGCEVLGTVVGNEVRGADVGMLDGIAVGDLEGKEVDGCCEGALVGADEEG